MSNIKITERELEVMHGVLDELLHLKYDELNKTYGSETIKDMYHLWAKLGYRDYCEKYGVQYEDMTEDDFEQAYRDKWEA